MYSINFYIPHQIKHINQELINTINFRLRLLMAEQVIDFTHSSKKIILNPTVPLSVLDIFCRTGQRVQATILGKAYPKHVEVSDIIPNVVAGNLKLDYQQHSKRLDYLQTIYPHLEVLGGLLTDINTEESQIPLLYTHYIHKDSGFKSRTLLPVPIIMSIGTKLENDNFKLQAYSFNQNTKSVSDLLGITGHQKWNVKLSFGSNTTEEITPLFTALNDQEQFLGNGGVQEIAKAMLRNLTTIQKHIKKIINKELPADNELGLALKKILNEGLRSKTGVKETSSKNASDLQLIQYLSNVVNVNSVLASKFNKMQ